MRDQSLLNTVISACAKCSESAICKSIDINNNNKKKKNTTHLQCNNNYYCNYTFKVRIGRLKTGKLHVMAGLNDGLCGTQKRCRKVVAVA